MQLRPRGVWNLRAGVRDGRPASLYKILIAGCVMVLAGCASMERPAATSPDMQGAAAAPARAENPAGFSSSPVPPKPPAPSATASTHR